MDRREWPILQDPNVARGSCLFWQTRRTEKDISLRFLTLIAQRLSVYPLGRQLFALQTDVCNLAASIAKIQLMHKSRKRDQTRCPSHGRDRSRVHSLPRAPLRPECRESTARAMITELAFCFWPTAKDARQGILCSITFDVRIHTHTALCFAARRHMAEARTRDDGRARTRSLSGNNLTSLEGRILTSKPPMSPPIPALVGYGEPGKSGVGNPVDDDPQCVRAPRSLA